MIKKFLSTMILCFPLIIVYMPLLAEEEWIDIKFAMENRARIYPLSNDDQVCIISPLRTGSTLVFNFFRFLFERDTSIDCFDNPRSVVRKSHSIKQVNNKTLYVFVMRNPIDTCLSMFRVLDWPFNRIANTYLHQMRMYDNLINLNANVCLLRYEQFNEDFDFLLNFIEVQINLKIFDEDKELLKNLFSKENILHQISNYNRFDEFDRLTHLHGNHIDRGEIAEEEKAQVKQIFFELLIEYEKEIRGWGYTLYAP